MVRTFATEKVQRVLFPRFVLFKCVLHKHEKKKKKKFLNRSYVKEIEKKNIQHIFDHFIF